MQEVDEWKKKANQQEQKGDRLREYLNRTERELYGILQKKYQYIRGGNGPSGQRHHRDFSVGGSRVGSGNIEITEKSQDINGANSDEATAPAQSSQVFKI